MLNLMVEGKEVYQELPDFGGGIPYFYSGNRGVPIIIAMRVGSLNSLNSLTFSSIF
jgi:hypothetical protein